MKKIEAARQSAALVAEAVRLGMQEETDADRDRAYLLKLVEGYQDMLSAMRNAQLPTDQMANLQRMTQKITALLEQEE